MRADDGSILQIETHDALESTAALAKEYAAAGYPDRYVVFSEGKIIRRSTSDKKNAETVEPGVYLSCILRPSMFISQAGFVRAMAALSAATALARHTQMHVGIGWISSIYCDGRLIGSTTTEGHLDSFSSYEYIIVSFEIKMSPSDFPPSMNDMIKEVFESQSTSLAMIVAKDILMKFMSLYPKQLKTPVKLMKEYKERFVLRGVKITHITAEKKRRCRVLGVDGEDGTLIVETRGGKVEQIANPRSVILPSKIKIKSK